MKHSWTWTMSLLCSALVFPLEACTSNTSGLLQQAGTIKVTSIATGVGSPVTNVFGEMVQAEDLSACLTASGGACNAVACSTAPPFALDNSGNPLTVSSSKGMFQALLDDSDQYLGSAPVALWTMAGETVTVSAPGGDVPGFTITAVSPPNLVVTSPDISTMPSIPLADDFKLTWTAVSDTSLHTFTTLYGNPSSSYAAVEIDCDFALGDGDGTIPQALLALLKTGQTGHLSVAPGTSRKASVGYGWSIAVQALSQTSGTGDVDISAGVDVTFQ